ncbi:YpjP family protein [Ornithinibacillus massiliensis]|uniref:YpjP family protein n=1 Tax=Ornithinibacillus massiliensis TaxID=1944633 RepID=A0ABS5M9M1_9BACI|nr:YpjP family protein [Ornithinibacillus massiliensis]MBS3679011.1 YpjP family protein [Ornithinibacillus massiliensis]
MNLWMRKIAVALIAIVTFGLYTPTYLIADEDNNEVVRPKENDGSAIPTEIRTEIEEETDVISSLTEKAKEQSFVKFGPKISQKVEDEFTQIILPKMEQALETILANEDASYLSITEQPSQGYGERIFNVYNELTKEDVAKFHVRRDNRPQDGYWFNFHYHLKDDNFEAHHLLGEIYWDKNTPPKWMS